MKKFLKKLSPKKICYSALTFILALLIIAGSLSIVMKVSFLSRGFMTDVLNSSSYYNDLCIEITDELTDLGDASGLDRSFFENLVDEVTVRKDVQSYIDNFYRGKKLTVITSNFEDNLRNALRVYTDKNNIKITDEKNIDYFVSKACKIYAKSVRITYLDSLQKLLKKADGIFTAVLIVSVLLAAGIVVVLLLTNEWKHKSVRYIYTATASSGLLLVSFPLIVYISGALKRLSVLSRSLSDLYGAMLKGFLNDILVIGIVFIVISAALWIAHNHIRRKSAI